MTIDPSQRAALRAAKLSALVKARWGEAGRKPVPFGAGAALVEGDRLWVLAEEDPERSLGAAIALGSRHQASSIHLLASAGGGELARRSRAFVNNITVWSIDGVATVEAEPERFPVVEPVPELALVYEDIFRAAGADPVREHGVLRAEVLGLEVARVAVDDTGAFLEVGVGKHDREAHRLAHGDRPPVESLAAAVKAVKERRRADALAHQVNQLAQSRWLRSLLMARPHVAGARSLWPIDPARPRSDLRVPSPAPAAGESLDGGPVLVVCSTGVDVDLVPSAADLQMADDRGPRLRIVVPAQDRHPLTVALVGRLRERADLVVVPDTWKAGLG